MNTNPVNVDIILDKDIYDAIIAAIDNTDMAGEKLVLRRNRDVFNKTRVQTIANIKFIKGLINLVHNSMIVNSCCLILF